MFKYIRSLLSQDLLVELGEQRLSVRSFDSEFKYECEPYIAVETIKGKKLIKAVGSEARPLASSAVAVSNPFKHSRTFVADFVLAEKILQHAFQKVSSASILTPSPRVIMHQLDKTEGGLTDIELKVLRELALGAGAREVLIHQGSRLNPQVESFNSIKARAT